MQWADFNNHTIIITSTFCTTLGAKSTHTKPCGWKSPSVNTSVRLSGPVVHPEKNNLINLAVFAGGPRLCPPPAYIPQHPLLLGV